MKPCLNVKSIQFARQYYKGIHVQYKQPPENSEPNIVLIKQCFRDVHKMYYCLKKVIQCVNNNGFVRIKNIQQYRVYYTYNNIIRVSNFSSFFFSIIYFIYVYFFTYDHTRTRDLLYDCARYNMLRILQKIRRRKMYVNTYSVILMVSYCAKNNLCVNLYHFTCLGQGFFKINITRLLTHYQDTAASIIDVYSFTDSKNSITNRTKLKILNIML